MRICVITTGGTIEKNYDEGEGTLLNRETVFKNRFLNKLRLPNSEVTVKSIMHKDSLDMVEADRALVLAEIQKQEKNQDALVVLHGTDTLQQTVDYCMKHSPKPSCPIVFTGAMKPLEIEDSDAKQNIIEALMAAQLVQPGYYLVFHSTLFKGGEFRKNKEQRTFEVIS